MADAAEDAADREVHVVVVEEPHACHPFRSVGTAGV
jgi:hypothetical protein